MTVEIIERALKIPGWMSKKELEWLTNQASSIKKGGVFLEIGSYCGRSLLAIGLSLPEGSTLMSVDINWGKCDLLDIFKIIKEKRGREINLHVIQSSSEDAYNLFGKNIHFDKVFIDANHTYENIHFDIDSWMKSIYQGGIISGHDYSDSWPDVKKAVNEILPNHNNYDSIWFSEIT